MQAPNLTLRIVRPRQVYLQVPPLLGSGTVYMDIFRDGTKITNVGSDGFVGGVWEDAWTGLVPGREYTYTARYRKADGTLGHLSAAVVGVPLDVPYAPVLTVWEARKAIDDMPLLYNRKLYGEFTVASSVVRRAVDASSFELLLDGSLAPVRTNEIYRFVQDESSGVWTMEYTYDIHAGSHLDPSRYSLRAVRTFVVDPSTGEDVVWRSAATPQGLPLRATDITLKDYVMTWREPVGAPAEQFYALMLGLFGSGVRRIVRETNVTSFVWTGLDTGLDYEAVIVVVSPAGELVLQSVLVQPPAATSGSNMVPKVGRWEIQCAVPGVVPAVSGLSSGALTSLRRAVNANVVPAEDSGERQRTYLELYRNPNCLPEGGDTVIRQRLPNLG